MDRDPSKRPTCEQLLQFPYFNNVKMPDLSYPGPKTIMSGNGKTKIKQSLTAHRTEMQNILTNNNNNRAPNSINLPQLTPTTPNLPLLADTNETRKQEKVDGIGGMIRLSSTTTGTPLKAQNFEFDIDSNGFMRRDSNNNGSSGTGAVVSSVTNGNNGVGSGGGNNFGTVNSAIVGSNISGLGTDTKFGASLTRSKGFEHLPNI